MWIKICGVTNRRDALAVVESGADAVGLNLVPSSPRFLEREAARELVAAVRGRIECVGVVADLPLDEARSLRDELGLDWLQLHGDEPDEMVRELLPRAYKAVRVADLNDVARAERVPGDRVLVDAKVPGRLGGSGERLELELIRELVTRRRVVLAGGLRPDDVAQAVADLGPFGVDVASGVELPGEPRKKDPAAVRAFVLAARGADASVPR